MCVDEKAKSRPLGDIDGDNSEPAPLVTGVISSFEKSARHRCDPCDKPDESAYTMYCPPADHVNSRAIGRFSRCENTRFGSPSGIGSSQNCDRPCPSDSHAASFFP